LVFPQVAPALNVLGHTPASWTEFTANDADGDFSLDGATGSITAGTFVGSQFMSL
jgi:hypothetical protein